mgnify:CR=1 FL=1
MPKKGQKHTNESRLKMKRSFTDEHRKAIGLAHKGKIVSKETREKIGKTKLGNKYWFGRKHTDEAKRKIGEKHKGKILSKETIEKLRIHSTNNRNVKLSWERIKLEIPNLEKQGFKCIPITEVIPDIIAIKDGEIYAIEVERGKPNYKKYDKNNYRKYFKDIIWLLRGNQTKQ